MKKYIPADLEQKWQQKWDESKIYQAVNGSQKEKKYILDMFPYPSGEGLHVGHFKGYVATDILSRFFRMRGFNVLHPMGWDAFGLPAENYAIKTGIHPKITTAKNIANIKRQMQMVGLSYDWDREFNTTDPNYYKWTQWIFLKLFEKGLAYEEEAPINWCPSCKTGLANEEVVNGKCERCGTPVERKLLRQWVLKITEYADRLIEGLQGLDWPQAIIDMQRNWIGRSEGALVRFDEIEVFTTRIDTIFGATFLVLAPEHPMVEQLTTDEHRAEVVSYVEQAKNKSELERKENKEKTGVFTGGYVTNPATEEKIPVWVADYVLWGYGTGAIMAVPAHDDRDFAFASKYQLPIKVVIEPVTGEMREKEEFRKSIVAIVRNPKTNEILSINWGPKMGGNLLIGGGVEENEDIIETAKREIQEETGYTNLKFVSQTEKVHHHYFAASKNVNRNIEAVGLLFELEDETQKETKLEKNEKQKFTVEWIPQSELESKIKDDLHKYVFQKLLKGQIYTGDGILDNSGQFDGLSSDVARLKITEWLAERNLAESKHEYHLRDWLFSRQRYWGEPIPLVHCQKCGIVPIPEDQLPVTLPEVEKYEPTGTGESPLAGITEWVNTTCPKCGGPARRETNTMPQWAGSSWYYLRFTDPHNTEALVGKEAEKYWLPVDWYVGGAEHAVLHLLYARFWHKFLFDLGVVSTQEPFQKLTNVGLVLAADGTKMSKSKGNVVSPDDMVKEYGADTLRVYEAFMGPFENAISWDPASVNGVYHFLQRIWGMTDKVNSSKQSSPKDLNMMHKTIKKVTDDILEMKNNTAVAALMEWLNYLSRQESISHEEYKIYLLLLAPYAPHITEELWTQIGESFSIHQQTWPSVNEDQLMEEHVTIVVQVNGKVRDNLVFDKNMISNQAEVETKAKESEAVKRHLQDKEIKKIIYIPGKILNIVS